MFLRLGGQAIGAAGQAHSGFIGRVRGVSLIGQPDDQSAAMAGRVVACFGTLTVRFSRA